MRSRNGCEAYWRDFVGMQCHPERERSPRRELFFRFCGSNSRSSRPLRRHSG